MEADLTRTGPSTDKGTGATTPLGEIMTIGRDTSNGIVVEEDQVSRNHAMIRRETDGYLIIDLGSANGTFVNGKPVTSARLLNSDDVIRIGGTEFVFHCTVEPHGRRRVKRTTTHRFFTPVDLAVLVSDVRNYTALSEALPADGLSSLLADWFRRVGRCIESRNGSIEKFRGDSVMAYWVSRNGDGNSHILGALRAADDLLAAAREHRQKMLECYPGHEFEIGCAVHCGEAVLGNIGADSRRDFTTLGDCVNVAFRMESLCAELGCPVLVSEAIKDMAEPEFSFENLGPHTLKGKSEPVRLYALRRA